jgi:methylthioribulose-1-phosphate dehydratase
MLQPDLRAINIPYLIFCEICSMETILEKTTQLDDLKSALVETIHFLHAKGWAPATSSNYSFREAGADHFWVSASGIDKGEFSASDLMQVNMEGRPMGDARRPSAETLLHVLLYERFQDTGCILHTHSVHNTVLSYGRSKKKYLELEGFEVLKGLSGIGTHEVKVRIPVFENSQDMEELSGKIHKWISKNGMEYGFLLAGHGFYTWAKDIPTAKRQMEVFEFLFEVVYKLQVLYSH